MRTVTGGARGSVSSGVTVSIVVVSPNSIRDDEVVELAVGEFDVPLDLVFPADDAVGRVLETDGTGTDLKVNRL